MCRDSRMTVQHALTCPLLLWPWALLLVEMPPLLLPLLLLPLLPLLLTDASQGANLIPSHIIHTNVTAQMLTDTLQYALDSNMNM